MKTTSFFVFTLALLTLTFGLPAPAQALSCVPVDMYLEGIVGNEDVLIFTGTSTERIEDTDYTAEVIEVSEAKQGYVEQTVYVYHEKDEAWGYLCNNGPADTEGAAGLYVASRDDFGKYNVHQRLSLDDSLIAGLEADLEEAEITGEIAELSPTDRSNQIMTTISDILSELATLLREFAFWRSQ